jgi:hypothetical protein
LSKRGAIHFELLESLHSDSQRSFSGGALSAADLELRDVQSFLFQTQSGAANYLVQVSLRTFSVKSIARLYFRGISQMGLAHCKYKRRAGFICAAASATRLRPDNLPLAIMRGAQPALPALSAKSSSRAITANTTPSSGYSAGTENTRKECHMVNEPNPASLKATATSLHLRPAINHIDAALEGMRDSHNHPGLKAQRTALARLREELQQLMDRPVDAESKQPDDYAVVGPDGDEESWKTA